MTQQQTILIVEDEPKIAQILVDFLTLDGFDTHVLYDGKNVIEYIRKHSPNMLILDVMLPYKDGLTLCKEIRGFSDIPVLMLTARVEEIDRLMGLGFGADDYVCKPFSPREVVARVQAILRRSSGAVVEGGPQSLLAYKNISLDLNRHVCTIGEHIVTLTPVEFRLLLALIKTPGMVYSRDQLMNNCYEDGRIVSARTIDSHMKNLRQKMTESAGEDLLHAVYGIGYKIE